LTTFVCATAEQIANRIDAGDICLAQSDAEAILQCDRQFHPRERINIQLEAEVHVQVERLPGISLLQKHPDSICGRILEQCQIFRTEPTYLSPRPPGQCLLIKIGQHEPPVLAQASPRQ
jgi:hypothetical protein